MSERGTLADMVAARACRARRGARYANDKDDDARCACQADGAQAVARLARLAAAARRAYDGGGYWRLGGAPGGDGGRALGGGSVAAQAAAPARRLPLLAPPGDAGGRELCACLQLRARPLRRDAGRD